MQGGESINIFFPWNREMWYHQQIKWMIMECWLFHSRNSCRSIFHNPIPLYPTFRIHRQTESSDGVTSVKEKGLQSLSTAEDFWTLDIELLAVNTPLSTNRVHLCHHPALNEMSSVQLLKATDTSQDLISVSASQLIFVCFVFVYSLSVIYTATIKNVPLWIHYVKHKNWFNDWV